MIGSFAQTDVYKDFSWSPVPTNWTYDPSNMVYAQDPAFIQVPRDGIYELQFACLFTYTFAKTVPNTFQLSFYRKEMVGESLIMSRQTYEAAGGSATISASGAAKLKAGDMIGLYYYVFSHDAISGDVMGNLWCRGEGAISIFNLHSIFDGR